VQEDALIERESPNQDVTEGIQKYTGNADAQHRQWVMHFIQMIDVYQCL